MSACSTGIFLIFVVSSYFVVPMHLPWHLYLLSILFILTGLTHFLKPKIYLRIMPRFLPAHRTLVYLSGLAEILLAAGLLFSETRTAAIYLIILMLFIFLIVHFYMLSSKKAGAGFPVWALILRIPLQFVLMYWAYLYLPQ